MKSREWRTRRRDSDISRSEEIFTCEHYKFKMEIQRDAIVRVNFSFFFFFFFRYILRITLRKCIIILKNRWIPWFIRKTEYVCFAVFAFLLLLINLILLFRTLLTNSEKTNNKIQFKKKIIFFNKKNCIIKDWKFV